MNWSAIGPYVFPYVALLMTVVFCRNSASSMRFVLAAAVPSGTTARSCSGASVAFCAQRMPSPASAATCSLCTISCSI